MVRSIHIAYLQLIYGAFSSWLPHCLPGNLHIIPIHRRLAEAVLPYHCLIRPPICLGIMYGNRQALEALGGLVLVTAFKGIVVNGNGFHWGRRVQADWQLFHHLFPPLELDRIILTDFRLLHIFPIRLRTLIFPLSRQHFAPDRDRGRRRVFHLAPTVLVAVSYLIGNPQAAQISHKSILEIKGIPGIFDAFRTDGKRLYLPQIRLAGNGRAQIALEPAVLSILTGAAADCDIIRHPFFQPPESKRAVPPASLDAVNRTVPLIQFNMEGVIAVFFCAYAIEIIIPSLFWRKGQDMVGMFLIQGHQPCLASIRNLLPAYFRRLKANRKLCRCIHISNPQDLLAVPILHVHRIGNPPIQDLSICILHNDIGIVLFGFYFMFRAICIVDTEFCPIQVNIIISIELLFGRLYKLYGRNRILANRNWAGPILLAK